MKLQKIVSRSLKKPKVGDVFVYSFDHKEYFFGSVIKTDVNAGGFPGAILIYAYNTSSNSKQPTPKLSKDDLLVPPVMINPMPWTRGYFEVVEHVNLTKEDIYDKHIFKQDESVKGGINEYGIHSDKFVPNCGYGGLSSYLSFETRVLNALIKQRGKSFNHTVVS